MKNKTILITVFWVLSILTPQMSRAADAAFNNAEHAELSSEKDRGRSPVYLYYAESRYQFLKGEPRVFPPSDEPVSMCRRLLETLVEGPSGDLTATIPEGTRVLAVYITGDKTAWIDLSREISAGPGGIRSEIMTLYSIVNTVVLNMPEVDQVKLLIEGREAETLAGHLDIRFPFKANMLLIR